MPHILNIVTTPETAASEAEYTKLIAKELRIPTERISCLRIRKKSIDARQKNIKVNLSVEVYVDDERPAEEIHFEYRDVSNAVPVIIVGSGPAGLFAALRAIELGFKPIVLERGKDVSSRKYDIAAINRNKPIDGDSNYAFGEGGAGTYSDGKLFTRSKKRGDHYKALLIFHHNGAPENILYEAHPHIGTDKLPGVISNIRKKITGFGGEVIFGCRVTDIIVKDGRATGVEDINGNRYEGAGVILATGHSARDIYELLCSKNITLEEKNFAMGVRVEHPQALIDRIQYKRGNEDKLLPPATYQLVTQAGGRGVYSFCMCPGGFIVPAATAEKESVVNGMSPSLRNSVYANSGIVTEIKTEDFAYLKKEHGILAGLRYQQYLEQAAYNNGGGMQIAPAQRLSDFVNGKLSHDLPKCSYQPGLRSSEFNKWLPEFIGKSLKIGFSDFGKKMKGFLTNEALILGVESRTSSPLRIPRDKETLEHVSVKMLFPCGEGAGYAGGIISAAVDGERCMDGLAAALKRSHII